MGPAATPAGSESNPVTPKAGGASSTGSSATACGTPRRPRQAPVAGEPASKRALRSQGRKTMRKLLDAAMVVFARRGYHAARVDDIVKVARTSHGTFYLYFSNKEDLLRALVTEAGDVVAALDSAPWARWGRTPRGGWNCGRGWSASPRRGSATPRCFGAGPIWS